LAKCRAYPPYSGIASGNDYDLVFKRISPALLNTRLLDETWVLADSEMVKSLGRGRGASRIGRQHCGLARMRVVLLVERVDWGALSIGKQTSALTPIRRHSSKFG
jgi:hypothetical protein